MGSPVAGARIGVAALAAIAVQFSNLLIASALLLASAAPVAAAPVTAIIFHGDTRTPAQAQEALELWADGPVERAIARFAKLADGYRKIVRSDSIPGMRPGHHTVVLGYCPAAQAEQLIALLAALDPEISGRTVDGPEGACPSVDPSWKVVPPVKVRAAASNTLTVTVVGDGSRTGRWGIAAVYLRDAAGKVLERTFIDNDGDGCWAFAATRLDRASVEVRGGCLEGCYATEAFWTVQVGDGISVAQRQGDDLGFDCGGAEP
jgi:hypothetical protein